MVDNVSLGGPLVLQGGSGGLIFAAAVKCSGCTGNVAVVSTSNASDVTGSLGLYDTSSANDGAASSLFGAGHLPYSYSYTPAIRLNFGQNASLVPSINPLSNSVGNAYPNPTNNSIIIPFSLYRDESVTVKLMNIIGQTVKSQVIIARGGQATNANISSVDLQNGLYSYSVEIGGERYTGKVVVAH